MQGCPKLDSADYSEKLLEIIRIAAKKALQERGKFIPWQTVAVSVDGKIPDD